MEQHTNEEAKTRKHAHNKPIHIANNSIFSMTIFFLPLCLSISLSLFSVSLAFILTVFILMRFYRNSVARESITQHTCVMHNSMIDLLRTLDSRFFANCFFFSLWFSFSLLSCHVCNKHSSTFHRVFFFNRTEVFLVGWVTFKQYLINKQYTIK